MKLKEDGNQISIVDLANHELELITNGLQILYRETGNEKVREMMEKLLGGKIESPSTNQLRLFK